MSASAAAMVQLELPVEAERPHTRPIVARYLRSTDAPELCECQREPAQCECELLFGSDR